MKSILLFSGICRRHFSNLAFGLFLQITFTHFDDYSIQILIQIIGFCKKNVLDRCTHSDEQMTIKVNSYSNN
jgi:hypothetical protein